MLVPELNEWYQQYLINLIEKHYFQARIQGLTPEYVGKTIKVIESQQYSFTTLQKLRVLTDSEHFNRLNSTQIMEFVLDAVGVHVSFNRSGQAYLRD